MEKTFKRLLSMAVVLVMVLGMVPASPIQVSAAGETPANSTPVDPTVAANAEAEARYQAALAAAATLTDPENLPDVCPLCHRTVDTWKVLSGETNVSIGQNGHGYLTGDVTYTGDSWFIGKGSQDACLFTNGYDVTAATVVEGKANVVAVNADGTDHSVITGLVTSSLEFNVNLYGGIYKNGDAENVIQLGNNATISIYNATVNAATNGRAIYTGNATVNIYGNSQINGGNVGSGNGGAICSNAGAVVNICGGTVQGGTAANGGNIYAFGRSKLTIGADATVTAGNATGQGGNILHNNNGLENSDGDPDGYVVIFGTVTDGEAVRGGNIAMQGTAPLTVSGGELSNGNASIEGGNLRTATNTITINGTLSGGTSPSGPSIANNGSTVNITGGTVTGGSTSNADGGVIYNNGGTVTISGGTITGGSVANGGVIYNKSGSVTVSGGTINGSTVTGLGGAIYATGGVVNITGGTIQNGTAAQGGNIAVSGAQVTIGENATITGGTATDSGNTNNKMGGGNIYATGANSVVTTSGKITAGKTTGTNGCGGNIEVADNASLTVSGGEISGGQAKKNGGNICVAGGSSVTINDGLVYGGTATGSADGGNIYAYGSNNLTFAGGVTVGNVYIPLASTKVNLTGSPKIVLSYDWTDENGAPKAATAGIGIKFDNDHPMNINGLQPDARISVATGVGRKVTEAYDGAANLTNCFVFCHNNASVNYRCVVLDTETNVFYVRDGHYKSLVAAKAATCAKEGNIAYYKCSGCTDLFRDERAQVRITEAETVTTRAHNYKVTYYWAEDYSSCTADYVCQYNDCQDQNKNGPVECDVKSDIVEEANCTTPGKVVYTATITIHNTITCTDTQEVDLPMADHVKDETTYVSPTEANVPGKWETKCATCGQVIDEWTTDDYVSIGEVKLQCNRKDITEEEPATDPGRGSSINVVVFGDDNNKSNQIILKLYDEADTLMSTTRLAEGKGPFGTKVNANIELTRDSTSWDTIWEEGYPNAAAVPYKIELYCNGGGMSTETLRYIKLIDLDEFGTWAGYEGVNPERSHVSDEAVRENVVEAQCEVAGSYDEVVYCVNCLYEISRVNKPIDALEHVFGDEKDKYCHNGCGKQNPDYAVVAFINGEPYATLEEALEKAEIGETVVLDVDCTAEEVYVRRGRKLDLNGCTLTVTGEVTAANATAQIIDSSNGEGVMVIAKDSVAFNAANTYLPVWVEEDNGFHFVSHTFTTAVRDHNDLDDLNEDQLVFRARLSGEADCFLAQQLADGGNDNGVSLKIKMTWTSATGNTFEQYFTVTEEKVMQYATYISDAQNWSTAYFQLKVTGVQNASDISFAAMVTYGTTVQITSDVSTVN